ncbi:hypothetical protein HY227_02760 [Candidatus Wolfebacteria bacterium]|nr:hypothetical protein [Candidatus Wolfebacteria bacterium]
MGWLLKITNLLNPKPSIGGLEISESDLRFILVKNNKLIQVSARLPAGIIEDGKVKDADGLKNILQDFHSKIISRQGKQIPVVVNIPDNNVFAQVFELPIVASENLKEAAELNLHMISPIDFESAYSDWQKIGEIDRNGEQLEILGGFIQKNIIDGFADCLKQANFSVVAFEFPGLSLSRLTTGAPIILLRLSSSGFSFSVLKEGNLYFSHPTGWTSGSASVSELENIITRETQKVLNFYANHWQSPISKLAVIVPNSSIEEKISEIIKNNFFLPVDSFINSIPLKIQKMDFSSLGPEWLAAFGSAIRGTLPRSEDNFISLASVNTREEFNQYQIMNFSKIWRNIIITSLGFITILFLIIEVFFINTTDSLNKRLAETSRIGADEKKIASLQDEIKGFNKKIDLALEAKRQTNDLSPFFLKVKTLAGNEILIDRISFQSEAAPVVFNGRATSEDAVIKFKNALVGDPQFSDINLPLTGVGSPVGGFVSFSLTFKTKL